MGQFLFLWVCCHLSSSSSQSSLSYFSLMCHSESLIPYSCQFISFSLWITAFVGAVLQRQCVDDVTAECWGGWCSRETQWQVWSGLFLSFSFGSHRCHNAPPGVWKLPGDGAMEVTPFVSVSQRWRWQTAFTLHTVTFFFFSIFALYLKFFGCHFYKHCIRNWLPQIWFIM